VSNFISTKYVILCIGVQFVYCFFAVISHYEIMWLTWRLEWFILIVGVC
jgi:hypothetical protein